jgi:plastocyanin
MRILLAAVVMAALATTGSAAAPPEVTVKIDNFTFSPAEIAVATGTTVVWENQDDIPHTVTGADADAPRLFRSDPLDTGEHFAYRFDHQGRFAYFCSLHAHMQGVVVVR